MLHTQCTPKYKSKYNAVILLGLQQEVTKVSFVKREMQLTLMSHSSNRERRMQIR